MGAVRGTEVEQFCDYLNRRGLKLTSQRMRIAETVFSAHRHFTSEELYTLVRRREPLVGRVTVYRTLEHLVRSGMVEELSIVKGVSTYEHTAGHVHHDHLVCDSCGRVEEFHSDPLEHAKRRAAEERGWRPDRHLLKIQGLCPDCLARAGSAGPKA